MPAKPRILIVGAGIAGFALAASLERFGITPVVVEIEKASLLRGLALLLTSNAVLALRRVGLDRVVIDQGIVLERIIHADLSGTPVEEIHDLGWSNDRYAPNLGITRDGLMSSLSSMAHAQVRYSTTITSVHEQAQEPDSNSRTGRAPVRSGRGRRRHPLGRAQGYLSARRARVPVILRVADGHGVPGLRPGLPAQHHNGLLPRQLPGRPQAGIRLPAGQLRRGPGTVARRAPGAAQGTGSPIPRERFAADPAAARRGWRRLRACRKYKRRRTTKAACC